MSFRALAEGQEVTKWRDFVVSETVFRADRSWRIQGRMVRTNRYKYIACSSGRYPEQLFDMQEDPGEMVNMAVQSRHAVLLNEHRKLLYTWCEETGDPFGAHYAHPRVPFLVPGYEFQ